jgi:hypothetical protein
VINAIKFSIEEIEASDQYFDHTGISAAIIWPMTFLARPAAEG